MIISTCQQCNTNFTVGIGCIGKFCSKSCNAKYYHVIRKRNAPIKQPNAHCKECNNPIFKPNQFCGHSCSAIFNNRLRPAGHSSRKSINSQRGKQKKQRLPYCKISWCSVCNTVIQNKHKKTCSDKCLHIAFQQGGIKSAATQVRRSADEIYLYNLCKNHFISVRHNEPIINGWDADIIIDEIKTAILWNGPWHYQKMPHKNHSLLQVQTRDKIKKDQLIAEGWNVLIFEDRYYTPDSAFQYILKRGLESNERSLGYEPNGLPLPHPASEYTD